MRAGQADGEALLDEGRLAYVAAKFGLDGVASRAGGLLVGQEALASVEKNR